MLKSLTNILLFALLIQSGLFAGNPHDLVIDYTTDNQPCANCHTTDEMVASTFSCLTCHDGVSATAVDINLPGSTLGTADTEINGMDHPVSIVYDEYSLSNSLRAKATSIVSWNSANTISDILYYDKIECVSCHNPHNKDLPTYLRKDNYRSELCKTCHPN